jgi:hypothetical protein
MIRSIMTAPRLANHDRSAAAPSSASRFQRVATRLDFLCTGPASVIESYSFDTACGLLWQPSAAVLGAQAENRRETLREAAHLCNGGTFASAPAAGHICLRARGLREPFEADSSCSTILSAGPCSAGASPRWSPDARVRTLDVRVCGVERKEEV